MNVYRRAAIAALAARLLFAPASAQAQTDEDKAAARALATQAAQAYSAGKHTEALDLVTRAEAILHAPTHLLLMARAQVGLGKLVTAKENYLKVQREELAANAPPAFKRAQQEAKDELAAIEPRIASLRVVLRGAAGRKVTVQIDGQPMAAALIGVHRPIDPGKHELAAFTMGQSPVRQQLELADGEQKEVTLVVPDAPSTTGLPLSPIDDPDAGSTPKPAASDTKRTGISPLAIAGIAGLGLGVGGVVVGGVFMGQSAGKTSEADELYKCDAVGCTPAEQSRINELDAQAASAQTIGIAGLVAGGVFLAGGATLLVLGLKASGKPKAATSAWVAPWVGPAAAGIRGEF